MKVILLKKGTIKKIVLLLIFAIIVTAVTTSFGMQNYYTVNFSTGLVTGNNVNIRSGPGINFTVVTSVKKNEYIRVFAGIGDWYVVQAGNDKVGVISKKYVKALYPQSGNNTTSTGKTNTGTGTSTGTGSGTSGSNTTNTVSLSADELEVFNLINEQRAKNRSFSVKNRSGTTKCSEIKS